MNKKIKVIDIFKRIEKHEDIPQNIKYKDNCYTFKHTNYSIDHLYELKGSCIGWLEHKDINLFEDVEILEDNTKEKEELDTLNAYKLMESPYMVKLLKEQRYDEFMEHLKQSEVEIANTIMKAEDKINELVKRINYIERKINE